MKTWLATFVVATACAFTSNALAQCSAPKDGVKNAAAGEKAACNKDGVKTVAAGESGCTKDGAAVKTAGGACCASKATAGGCTEKSKDGVAKCCDKSKDATAALCHDMKATGMPAMKFKVGEEIIGCTGEATAKAEKEDLPIRYVVADKVYDSRPEAMQAYQAELDKFLAAATTVRYAVGDECVACPEKAKALAAEKHETMKFRVAAFTFADQTKAETAAQAAAQAADGVKLQKVVDGKLVACESKSKTCSGEKTAAAGCAKTCSGEKTAAVAGAKTCTGEKEGQATAGAKTVSDGETATAGTKTCTGDKDGAKVATAGAKTCTGDKDGTKATLAGAKGTCHGDGAEGDSAEYVIGETKTRCPVTAEVELVKAKIYAAYKAAEKANTEQLAGAGV